MLSDPRGNTATTEPPKSRQDAEHDERKTPGKPGLRYRLPGLGRVEIVAASAASSSQNSPCWSITSNSAKAHRRQPGEAPRVSRFSRGQALVRHHADH